MAFPTQHTLWAGGEKDSCFFALGGPCTTSNGSASLHLIGGRRWGLPALAHQLLHRPTCLDYLKTRLCLKTNEQQQQQQTLGDSSSYHLQLDTWTMASLQSSGNSPAGHGQTQRMTGSGKCS